MLTLLTATGARPEAFALCQRWMMRQTYAGPVRWIIVDDGPTPQPIHFKRAGWELEVIHPQPLWRPGQNTQARNLLAGLDACDASASVLFIEDDDHYAPAWLETCARELQHAELVGEISARYYNIASRKGRHLGNTRHSSLCSTAMRGAALDTFRIVCSPGVKFIDMNLWKRHPDRHLFRGSSVTGIKGLPGRSGIGMGHRQSFTGANDPDLALLRQWIGNDAECYL